MQTSPTRATRRIPLLAWCILAFVLMAVIGWITFLVWAGEKMV